MLRATLPHKGGAEVVEELDFFPKAVAALGGDFAVILLQVARVEEAYRDSGSLLWGLIASFVHMNAWKVLLLFVSILFSIQLYADTEESSGEQKVFIAVVGGTTFGDQKTFGKGLVKEEGVFTIETRVGTSPPIYRMRYKGVPFYYIRMYGYEARKEGESEAIGHIRCWVALYDLGITHVIGGASSGGIRTDYDYDDLIIVDDFMEMENTRPHNILDYSGIERPGVFQNYYQPYSPSLRKLLISEARKVQEGYTGKLYEHGVFVQHNPERFETAAEVRAMRILGGDLCSENIATATTYARQLGIRFAAICSIANPAVGVRPFSFVDMQNSVQRIAKHAVPIVLEAIARIPQEAMDPEPISTGEKYRGSYTNPDSENTDDILEQQ